MRKPLSGIVAVSALAALFVLYLACACEPRTVAAQQQQRGVNTYAITNARIVPVSSPTIERGTIVMRDGIITAVGASVVAPADARIIDGAGLTVYPGLIDAATNLGIPTPSASPTASPTNNPFAAFLTRGVQPSATSPNSTQPPGLQPEIFAADIVRPGGEQIEAARNAGVTSALTMPRGLIFLGQSAFINLSGETPQQMTVRTPIALHVGFTPLASGNYPASTMGVISAIRQMFLDARRYRETQAIYERSPRGLRRPEPDKSLAALQPALDRQMPVVFLADREREISRALDLAQEFNLRAIIAGGADAWRLTERLRAQKVPVLLSLNFPRRQTANAPDADPEPLRVLRERAEAPKVAARLAQAGVVFAFQSGAMTNMADYLGNASKAVEQGLPREEALRAMTLRAAEIFDLADRLGSIETGKIANLTVTRGDLFARDRRITHVFIDGRPVDLKPVTTAASGQLNIAGTWTLRVNTGGTGETEVTLTLQLQQQGTTLTGSIQGPYGSAQIANTTLSAAGELRFTAMLDIDRQTLEAHFRGTVTGNEMSGSIDIVGRNPGTFTGTRPASPTAPATAPATAPVSAPTPASTPSASPSPSPEPTPLVETREGNN